MTRYDDNGIELLIVLSKGWLLAVTDSTSKEIGYCLLLIVLYPRVSCWCRIVIGIVVQGCLLV